MEVVGRLLALLVVLLLGTGARATGILDDGRTALLNDGAYYVALPALIFVSTFDRSRWRRSSSPRWPSTPRRSPPAS